MEVVLSVPDDILEKLQAQWDDLPHHALEALAAAAYRAGRGPGRPGGRSAGRGASPGARPPLAPALFPEMP